MCVCLCAHAHTHVCQALRSSKTMSRICYIWFQSKGIESKEPDMGLSTASFAWHLLILSTNNNQESPVCGI